MFGKKGKGKTGKDTQAARATQLVQVVEEIFKNTESIRQDMDRYTKEFKGQWWDKSELRDTDSTVFANYLFSTVMTTAPLLTDNRPIWSVVARNAFMQKYFNMYNLALEYLWDKLEMDDKLLQLVLDGLIRKVGIFKVSFDPDSEFAGEVRVDVVDPRTFFIAAGYDDVWDAPFCGEKKSRSMYWIKENYPDANVQPDSGEEWSGTESWQGHNTFATVYEMWLKDSETEEVMQEVENIDQDTGEKVKTEEKVSQKKYPYGKIVVFTKDEILEEKPYVYEHGKPPYIIFHNYKQPHEFYGIGEAEQIEELNKSFNMALQQLDEYITLYTNPNWVVDSMAGMNVEAIKKDLPKGGNVWAANTAVSGDPIKQTTVAPINRSVIEVISILPNLIEEVTGVTDISKGMAAKAQRQSATEISSLLESSYTRTRQRVRNLEFTIKRLCWQIVSIMQQFYTEVRTVNTKKDDDVEWFDVTSDRQMVGDMMRPEPPEGMEEQQIDMNDPEVQKYMQEKEDYEAFIKIFGKEDTVYADFDIEIQTNSTLPLDKQSLSNMMIKLVEQKVVDAEAVIKQLRLPGGDEIIARMQKKREEAIKAKSGGGQQAPPMPGPPPAMRMMGGNR